MRWSIGSWSAFSLFTGKYSSIRVIPFNPMFWVISTALVLHGVIISLRGPTNQPSIICSFSTSASLKSQLSFSVSWDERVWSVSTAITFREGVLKKRTIIVYLNCELFWLLLLFLIIFLFSYLYVIRHLHFDSKYKKEMLSFLRFRLQN